jgi:hypothetical protein
MPSAGSLRRLTIDHGESAESHGGHRRSCCRPVVGVLAPKQPLAQPILAQASPDPANPCPLTQLVPRPPAVQFARSICAHPDPAAPRSTAPGPADHRTCDRSKSKHRIRPAQDAVSTVPALQIAAGQIAAGRCCIRPASPDPDNIQPPDRRQNHRDQRRRPDHQHPPQRCMTAARGSARTPVALSALRTSSVVKNPNRPTGKAFA